jgi:hypothetical protein
MGRSVPTYRWEMEKIIKRWGVYRRRLNCDNQKLFDRMMNRARSLASAGYCQWCEVRSLIMFVTSRENADVTESYQCYYDPTKTIFLCIMLDQLGELREIKKKMCRKIYEKNTF